MEYTKEQFDNKWPKNEVIYNGRALRGKSLTIAVDVRNFVIADDAILKKLIVRHSLKKDTYNETAFAIQKYVTSILTYADDDSNDQCPEFWQFPFETIASLHGDCVFIEEEIYTIDGIKKVKDLLVGDLVLSYDLDKKEYCYKPILKIWEKGELPLKKVHFRNGQHVNVTDNHPFWTRQGQKESKYEKTYLSDIDLTRWWKRKTPVAKKIPYEVKDIEWMTEDLCMVIGHYLAEGWIDGSHVQSSGYELLEYILPILEKYDIPFTEYTNNSGVPCINFLKSDFKEYLKQLKDNSFDIHLPEEVFHLPENKLKALLYGEWLGDGHYGNYEDKRGYINKKQDCYSTSSEQFARDIQRIGLQLGNPYHIWKQEHHGGVGNKPIYRITYNPESHFLKDFGYNGISEVSIREIEDLGYGQMRDFEVADTHTFIFKNGILGHNCEDGAILMASLMINAGIPAWRVKVCAGIVQEKPTAPEGGHAYCIYLADRADATMEWEIHDWCYCPDVDSATGSKVLAKDGGYDNMYKSVWFTFNNEFSWTAGPIAVDKNRVK